MGRIALISLALSVALFGCREELPTQVWTPDDHAHPPSAEVDPARIPAEAPVRGELSPEARTAQAAASLFQVSCASCHGNDGRGRGPGLPPGAAAPDFTSESFQASRTDAEIERVIAEGQGMMPGFGTQVTQQGIEALRTHVRSLGPSTRASN